MLSVPSTVPRAGHLEVAVRNFVRLLKGADRAVKTQTTYRRAAPGLVQFLEQDGPRSANVTHRMQQLMRWLLDYEEIGHSPTWRPRQ